MKQLIALAQKYLNPFQKALGKILEEKANKEQKEGGE